MKLQDIYELYGEVVEYAKHLEELLKKHTLIDDEFLKSTRKKYIKPVTNIAKEWVE